MRKLLSNTENYILAVCFLIYGLLASGFVGSLRTLIPVYVFASLLIFIKTKNLFTSLFLISIISFQFFAPNKYYAVEIIKGYNLLELYKNEGYYLGYGVNGANIMIFLTIVSFLRAAFIKKNLSINWLTFKPVAFSGLIFFLIGFYSSYYLSPHPEASLVWLMQYCQIFITTFLVYIFLTNFNKFSNLLFLVLSTTLIFQGLIGVLQFIKQSSLRLPIEQVQSLSFFATGLDEANALFRISGTYAYHNQSAFIMLILLILIFHKTIRGKIIYVISSVLSLVFIILTQSRSTWASLLLSAVALGFIYKNQIITLVNTFTPKRVFIYAIVLYASLSFIIIPRVILTSNTFHQGAGLPIRIKLINEGLEALVSSPWIGFGVGTNETTLFSMFPDGVMTVFPASIHFAPLQMALEVGIIGFMAFVFPFFWVFRKFSFEIIRSKNSREIKSVFMICLIPIVIYYSFLPHTGIIEFNYLGIILGIGIYGVYLGSNRYGQK